MKEKEILETIYAQGNLLSETSRNEFPAHVISFFFQHPTDSCICFKFKVVEGQAQGTLGVGGHNGVCLYNIFAGSQTPYQFHIKRNLKIDLVEPCKVQ